MSKEISFDDVYSMYCGRLMRVALRLCQDHCLAEDITQETWLRVFKDIDRLSDVENIQAWLMQILRNEHLRCFSKKTHTHTNYDSEQVPNIADHGQVEDAVLLAQTLNSIGDEQHPLVLEVVEGLSQSVIAKKLGISKNSLRSRVCRERQRLKQGLSSGIYGMAA